MRILVLNWQDRNHPQAGGAETHLHEIFGRIVALGHEVTLFASQYEGASPTDVLDGIRVIRWGSRSLFNYAVPIWWYRFGRKMGFDVVVDDINKIPFMSPLFVNKPTVGIIHHLFGSSIFVEAGRIVGSYVSFFERLIPRVYRRIPIAVVSESTRVECMELGLPDKNIHVIHNGIDVSKFPMRVSEKNDEPTVVYFGRLKKYKSVDHVVRAFSIVHSTMPESRLQIIGRGDEAEALVALVADLGLTNVVSFEGWVSGEEKVLLLSRAHVVVYSSVKEGWGITNMEANACGTPVISADSPGLRDSVNNGVSGTLYSYGDIDLLAKRIREILGNEDLRLRLSHGAINWASTFTWERSAQEMLALCKHQASKWESA